MGRYNLVVDERRCFSRTSKCMILVVVLVVLCTIIVLCEALLSSGSSKHGKSSTISIPYLYFWWVYYVGLLSNQDFCSKNFQFSSVWAAKSKDGSFQPLSSNYFRFDSSAMNENLFLSYDFFCLSSLLFILFLVV